MPTIQEIIAKRKELWPTATTVDAKNAITPVSPTTNANVAQLEANRARVQSQIESGERPAVGTSVTPQAEQTQAPTPPPAPVTSSTTPNGATLDANWTVTAPTTEQNINNQLGWVIQPNGINSVQPINAVSEMPATPKADPTPWITQDAFQQAKSESEKIKAQNDAIMAQNKQKSDLAREDLKLATDQKTAEAKQAQDQANTALANDENAILTTLKTGWMIPESVKSSPFYKSAQQTYNKLQQYSTYSTSEMVTAMNQGSIVPWTNVYNEMMKDPAMKQKLTDAQVYRAGNPVNSTQIYENASSEIMSNNPTTANYLADGVITQDEYNQATNNTEVVAKAKEVEEKANKYNTLKAEYDSIEDEVNAQFPWSPFADSIIADRQKAKYKNLVLAKWEWETSTGTLTELKSQASTLFETNLNLAETRRAEQNQIASEQRKIQAEKDMMQYEADFNKKQAEEALNDPATAIKAVMDEYKKLGIPFTSTVQSRLAEFKASGKPLEQFLTEMWENIQQSPAYKKYQELQQGQMSDTAKMKAQQDFDIQKIKLQDSMKDRNIQRVGGTNDNPIYGYIDGNKVVTVSVPWSTTTGTTPTGNIVPVTAGNKTVRLDQVWATGFESAINQLTTAWIPIVVWQGARDQSATIKEMADRYGIPFNSSNPAETAWKLRKAGHQVADPWKSNHESGMAIDVYWDSKLWKVSPAQEKILNANWWYSAGIPGDAGHFEYRGGGITGDSPTIDNTSAYQKRLNTGALPTWMKEWTAQANEWLQGYTQWKQTNNPLSESVQKRVDSYSDDYSKNPNVQSAFKFAPLLRQYDTVKVSDLSSSQRQGIISDYAKALDPDSVVREWEYATVAKYSSSFWEKTLSEINQFLSGNGTLSDAAAQKVIDAIKSRGKNYVEQEKNVRNQYIEKINRATGYKDGDTQLVYPDYSTQSTNPQKSDFLNALKSIATEFTKGLTSIK